MTLTDGLLGMLIFVLLLIYGLLVASAEDAAALEWTLLEEELVAAGER